MSAGTFDIECALPAGLTVETAGSRGFLVLGCRINVDVGIGIAVTLGLVAAATEEVTRKGDGDDTG